MVAVLLSLSARLASTPASASTCGFWDPVFLLPAEGTPVSPNVVVRVWVDSYGRRAPEAGAPAR